MIASNGRPARAGRWILFALAFCAMECAAASLTVAVEGDRDGDALDGAVVSLHSQAARASSRPGVAEVVQRGQGFLPRVMPVTVGSEVRFASHDGHRHELYAFSPARPFRFALHDALPGPALRFERAGLVEYGCAIHDGMLGYVLVLDTPYFATTGERGLARLEAPTGDYTLQVWHEWQPPGDAVFERAVHVEGDTVTRVALPVRTAPAAAPSSDVELRRMRERFRRFQRGG